MIRGSNKQAGWPWSEVNIQPPAGPAAAGNLPRISIITPSYNQGAFIEETIRSVILQHYPRLEFIVIDGDSADNTVEIIKRYSGKIHYWVSERDRGQSHAINKGIARCTGDIFNWINSDDLLMPGALWAVAETWLRNPGAIIAGHTEFFSDKRVTGVVKARDQSLRNFVRFWEADRMGWSQPSTFVPLADLKAVGGIEEDLTYCMDYQLMVRLLMQGVPVTYVDQTLARFRLHPESKTVGSKEDFRLERVPALRRIRNLPISVEDWEWDAEQARRLVDVARHAWRCGGHFRAVRLVGLGVAASPRSALGEILRRAKNKLQSRAASAAADPRSQGFLSE